MIITLTEYQDLAEQTSGGHNTPQPERLAVAALGLAGEAGEVADLVKKYLGHGHGLELTKVSKELGDILWYVAETCSALGLSLEDVAQQNIKKLQERYPDGFSHERSQARQADG